MKSHINRSTHATYTTSGNLALVPDERPVFTLIEGGSAYQAEQPRSLAERRAERREAERQNRRMRIEALFAFFFVVSTLVFAVIVSNALIASSQQRAFSSVPTTTITVSDGDSLWAIAQSHPVSGVSTRDVSRWIMKNNQLETGTILVGQSLVVPDTLLG